MIYIIEKESKKVSGNTSLFLSFLFNQDIIDIIKKSGPCYYNKDSKMWEVPISSLSHLLDTLTYYDDITLIAQEEEKEKEEIKPKLEFKTKPFPYQVEGITYGLNCKKWLLLDSPGLGKTLQAIYLAEELKAHHGLKKCLIVCGVASLRANWEKEIKKHSTQDCIIVGKKINSKGRVVWDTVAKRAQQLNNKIDEFFIILNIETLRSDEVIEALKRNVNKIDMIILDEAHKCLVGDTLIDTNIGKLKIEEIVKNHIQCEVKTLNIKNQEVEYKPINEYFELSTTELIELTIQKDDSTIITLTCTPDHKVYTHNRGYVEASQLKETDILEVLKDLKGACYTARGKLISKKIIKKDTKVYDLEVLDNHNFYADAVLVHNCKGWSSQQGKNLLKLKDFSYKLAMTGTLLMNNPLDAYVPLKWINVEKANITAFKKQYCELGGFGGHEIIGFKNLDSLRIELESCSLRRTKALLELPPKNVILEYVEMSDAHREFYESVRDGIKEECDKIDLNKNNLLALTTRLRQATSCPSVLTSQNIESSKIERCVDLVEEIVSNGDKVVIMSTFKEPVYHLEKLLAKYKPLIGTGDTKEDVISTNIDSFQNDDEHMVFIGTTAKMGTGLTLNRASYMICIDSPWTAALQEQVEDRIHRIGSKHPVFIYRLICENSIDVMVAKLLERKKALSDFVIDDINDEDTINLLRKYIKEEM